MQMTIKTKTKSEDAPLMQTKDRYGWLVVFVTFVIGFITDGIQLSFGILLIELLDTFEQGRAPTAIIGSLVMGVMYLVGPIAGRLSEKFGCRVVVIAGSLISSTGFIISGFVDNMAYLYVTYGLLGGLGFGLMYLPSTVCLMQHFEKHRATANGVAMCGTGVGTFTFNILTGFLLEVYGWRGTMLVQAGIVLNGVACGLILVSPSKDKKRIHINGTKEGTSTNTDKGDTVGADADYNTATRRHPDERHAKVYADIKENDNGMKLEHDIGKHSCTDSNEFVLSKEDRAMTENSTNLEKLSFKAPTISSKDLDNLKVGKPVQSAIDTYNSDTGIRNSVPKMDSMCRSSCDLSLLKKSKLLAMLASVFCVALAFSVPFNYIPDQAVENGMNKRQTYWLASSMGITNIVSRIAIGWISDRKCVNRLVLLEALLIAVGIATVASVLLESFELKLLYTCIYGFLIGGYVVLNYVVIADLFGVEVVARSFGLLMFTIGTGSLLAAPLAGWLYDQTGSYEIPFIVAGSEFIIGACILPVPFLMDRFQNKRSYQLSEPLAES